MKTLKTALLASTLMVASTASYAATDLLVAPLFSPAFSAGSVNNYQGFSLSAAADVTVTLSNNSTGSMIDFTDLTFTLFDSALATTFGSFTVGELDIETATFTLAAGEYMANVSGDLAAGATYGAYQLTAVASPVPEASTLSLMMAGFGLVGLMSYRRRNSI